MSGRISIAGKNETSPGEITPLSIFNTTKQFFNTTDLANYTNADGIESAAERNSGSESTVMIALGIFLPIVIFSLLNVIMFWWKKKMNAHMSEQTTNEEAHVAENNEGDIPSNDLSNVVDEHSKMICGNDD